ncbi:MAG TPA: EfeM/EfeO family lipoprotein [Polyangiales bacterium]|jgi:iron uptake system component EfeO
MTKQTCLVSLLGCALASACGGDDSAKASDVQTEAILGVKDYVNAQLKALATSSIALQKAAPAPDDDGWNATDDAAAVDAMKKAWAQTRDAYEKIEGSIAVLFPQLDVSTDERYDGFLGSDGPDDDLFDGQGVTGVHAIERILWSDSIPERVVAFESTLDGYVAASFPTTKQDADEFKNGLCQRLVDDVKKMQDEFGDNALDSSAAFRGMIGSMQEQSEKTTLAASGEDESRYAQRTLDDMRANLAGAEAVFKAFQPWINKAAGQDQDTQIQSGFKMVGDAYSLVDGSALPAVPDDFNPDSPSDADLQTPYGKLWKLLQTQTDLNSDSSLVSEMSSAADEMQIPEYM